MTNLASSVGIGEQSSAAEAKTETAIEIVVRKALAACESIQKGNKQLWSDWLTYGEGLKRGSDLIKRSYPRNAYPIRYGAWLKENALDKFDESTRAALLNCMRKPIAPWRKNFLDESGRIRCNNPQTVWKAYRADVLALEEWRKNLPTNEFEALEREEDSLVWQKFAAHCRKVETEKRAEEERKAAERALRRAEVKMKRAQGIEVPPEELPQKAPTKAMLQASVAKLTDQNQTLVSEVKEARARDFDTANPDNEQVAQMMLDKLGSERAAAIASAVLRLVKSKPDNRGGKGEAPPPPRQAARQVVR